MKRFLISIGLIFLFLFSPSLILAENEFETNYKITYQLQEDEKVKVTQEVHLTNKLADVYASEYSFEIGGAEISEISAQDGQGKISPVVKREGDSTKIKLGFNQRVVGEGKTLSFSISYKLLSAIVKNGQVWEVNLPKMPDLNSSGSGELIMIVPKSFGTPTFISPSFYQKKTTSLGDSYIFKKEKIGKQGISAAFGQFQIFDFSFKYHLHNPHSFYGKIMVAFPPDTSFQKVYYEKIDPLPENIIVDEDGNWLGQYSLKSDEKVNILVSGSVKIFSEPWDFYLETDEEVFKKNLSPQLYWESDNNEIIKKAKELKTAEAIYRFVVNHLDYDYTKVEKQTQREGGLFALKHPDKSICMEFTDLFITLCRAADIPAREVNGYAYTNNDRLKPLSLFSDILHSWPEYWDREKKIWIPVDPTWEKTTGGRDYFSKFDLNHFTFVAHGVDSQSPPPAGAYKVGTEADRDIKISFGEYQPIKEASIEVSFNEKYPGVTIGNPGPMAIYQLELRFDSEKVKIKTDFAKEQTIKIIPPFSKVEIPIGIEKPKIFEFGQAALFLFINGKKFTYPFKLEKLIWPRFIFTLAGICLGILWTIGLVGLSKFFIKKILKKSG